MSSKFLATETQWVIVQAFFRRARRSITESGASEWFKYAAGSGVARKSVKDIYTGVPTCLVYEAFESTKNDYWKAEIAIGSGIGYAETVIVLVTGPENNKIADAELILLGSTLKVKEGIAFYNLNDFQRDLSNTKVELVSSGRRIPGTLKLGTENLL